MRIITFSPPDQLPEAPASRLHEPPTAPDSPILPELVRVLPALRTGA